MVKSVEYAERIKRTNGRGLCYNCGKPLNTEGVRCAACAAKVAEYSKLTREWLRANHICVACGKERVLGNDKICFECRAKSAERPKYRKTDEQKKRERDKARTTYHQRCELGVCTVCGRNKAVKERRKCAVCANKEAERARLRRSE